MSWSQSAEGNPSLVKERASTWADNQKALDSGLDAGAAAGHQKQIQAAVSAVGAVCDSLESPAFVSVQAWGHHDGRPESDSGSVSIKYNVPMPVIE